MHYSSYLTSLRVEEGERLVSEEQSDEFQVFPEMRRGAETTQSSYAATRGKSPEILLTKQLNWLFFVEGLA